MHVIEGMQVVWSSLYAHLNLQSCSVMTDTGTPFSLHPWSLQALTVKLYLVNGRMPEEMLNMNEEDEVPCIRSSTLSSVMFFVVVFRFSHVIEGM